MGLKEIKRIRQYTTFDPDGKVVLMYEVAFTTEKSMGEFTLDVKREEFSPEKARKLAQAEAEKIDKAIG